MTRDFFYVRIRSGWGQCLSFKLTRDQAYQVVVNDLMSGLTSQIESLLCAVKRIPGASERLSPRPAEEDPDTSERPSSYTAEEDPNASQRMRVIDYALDTACRRLDDMTVHLRSLVKQSHDPNLRSLLDGLLDAQTDMERAINLCVTGPRTQQKDLPPDYFAHTVAPLLLRSHDKACDAMAHQIEIVRRNMRSGAADFMRDFGKEVECASHAYDLIKSYIEDNTTPTVAQS